jgi:predicted protein tyrosine phosphatase
MSTQRPVQAVHRPRITILGVAAAEAWVPGPNEICISIRSPGAEPARLSPNFRDVLRLYFHDVGGFDPPYPEGTVEFSEEAAEQIAAFVRAHAGAATIVVHCEAGISRSVAVGLAISTTVHGYWAWPSYMPREYRERRYVHNRVVFDAVCAALVASDPTS